MQRVAIARALVNDPDILLADEPTGALDSETSVQVMELLKEVARDRLVVMVTHNPELAEAYATRIVELRDGIIRSDSNPYEVSSDKLEVPRHENMGKSSMSFLTSLLLSFNNLRTKKARTILTSFAGSIGIIGIALILSLSNGVNQYIQSIEEETLSEYPLQIQSTGFDITSMMTDTQPNQNNEEKDDTKIHVSQMITNMFSKIGSNDLTSLKKYLDSGKSNIKENTNSIEYTYNVAPQIYSTNTDLIRQVNPDKSFSSLGLGSSANSNSLMSSMMSTDVFYQMPSNTSLYEDQYDIKAGNWPKNYNECVLVLTKNGNINDFMLYTLGLRDYSELDKMIEQFSKEETVNVPTDIKSYSYKDILGIEFKLVNASDYYQYDSKYNVYKDKTDDENYMKNLIQNGENIKIVGIVQPKDSASATMLQSGIGYPAALTNHVIEQAASSEIVNKQISNPNIDVFTGKEFSDKTDDENYMKNLIQNGENIKIVGIVQPKDSASATMLQSGIGYPAALTNHVIEQAASSEIVNKQISNPNIDVFTGKEFSDKNSNQLDMNSLFTVDGEMMKKAFSFDQNKLSFDMGDLDLSQIKLDSASLPSINMDNIFANMKVDIPKENIESFTQAVMTQFQQYLKDNGLIDPTKMNEYFMAFLQTDQAQKLMQDEMIKLLQSSGATEQFQAQLERQMQTVMTQYTETITKSLQQQISTQITKQMGNLANSMQDAIKIDTSVFAQAIKMNMNEEELSELMMSLMTTESSSYEGNLKNLGYADFDKPSAINIYPKDFETKQEVINILDSYNENIKKIDEDKVISYTDYVVTLMSSVTDIINVISYVLIAFVAISLVVSSIMIGVITYISVLERKKEIGILRAIGASKKNISQVFNAETFIIGLLAGVLGIGITLILLIPGNALIHEIAGNTSVSATLPIMGAIILIVLSVLLTLLGGLIPSKKAALEDPVTALRSE